MRTSSRIPRRCACADVIDEKHRCTWLRLHRGERVDGAGIRENIGSGRGVVHNAYLLERTGKSIVRAPFSPFPEPPWFVTNAAQAQIGRALCEFEANRTPLGARCASPRRH